MSRLYKLQPATYNYALPLALEPTGLLRPALGDGERQHAAGNQRHAERTLSITLLTPERSACARCRRD
jgi:hypothetical protein